AEKTENLHTITSPMVGTFYAASAEDAPPYVAVHDRVEPASIVCIVEAMKLFNEIEAEVKGEIVSILVQNGQLVDHGQPLFLVKLAE
ncbi:acetyl-CoA carboxylase biotin carboxyl carrier protein, partial [Mesorhizobium sp. M00.F.Ca.ET.186.01.1.1]